MSNHTLPSRGRPAKLILMSVKREITQEDIVRLAKAEGPKQAPAPTVQRLRASHHAAARYLAAGRSITETAILVGRTPQRIGDLARTDPAFIDLVERYKQQVAELDIDDAAEFQLVYKDIHQLASEEVLARLEDPAKRNKISVGELRNLMAEAADRTVAPRKVASSMPVIPTKVTVNIGTRDIRPRGEIPGGEILDLTPEEVKDE